jgi:hypothetical protein
MRRSIGLFIILSVMAIGMLNPVDALGFEERIYVFKTLDDPDVQYDPAVLERAPWWNPAWDAENPPPFIVPLGASVWMFATNGDGKVVKDTVRRIGTGTAVGLINDPTFTPYGTLAPFYFEMPIKQHGHQPDLTIAANGYAIVTSKNAPELGIIMLGINMTIIPDAAQGILGGSASSNSIYNLMGLPGYQTGSYWTVRIDLE